ncbi:molybdate ABC transporter substrate-binding protein [Actinopolymorpha alba]|uniref:molybdate ABC transporter substrate-binding protein n=1 Tax=Actinopolymorpha alba TaxID=533267 RepID=UPI0003765B74|nr:molybdate ABC transporter substrate-binding protein [Actinopolymorpha alba]
MRRRLVRPLIFLGMLALALTGCGSAGSGSPGSTEPASRAASPSPRISGTVTVLAAASLTESFGVLADEFERAHPGTTVRTSFGASSALASQITNGAPADIFAAASPETMRQVVDARAARSSSVFARNHLQIAVPRGNPGKVTGLADFGRTELRIAVCAPQVPCGAAATKAFSAADISAKPDTYGNDVKAVLTAVRTGEVDAGLVYRTDVRAAGNAVTGISFPESAQAINDYPIAVLANAPNPSAAKAFVAYVRSEAGRRALSAAGFDVP